MSQNVDFYSNGLLSTPLKTLWFEFLLQPKLIDSHLTNESADPTPFELLSQLLSNTLTAQSTTMMSTTTAVLSAGEETNSLPQPVMIKKSLESKKNVAIRHLAFKLVSHLKWDLNLLETSLPVTQQDFLLSEFINYCDKYNAITSCKLFSCIVYYRWILRYIMRANYPLRSPKGPTISLTLQQQIDPCFVSTEALDCLMKKLQEQYLSAVNDLEKLVCEKQMANHIEICIPTIDCFAYEDNDFVCKWENCVKLNTSDVIDDILYDIGRWFFFHEDYFKANSYLELITITKRDSYKHLDGYLISTRELMSDRSVETQDIEIIDLDEQVNHFIDKLVNDQTSDISFLESIIDLTEISNALQTAFKRFRDDHRRAILNKLAKYLCSKIKGLTELLDKGLFLNNDISKAMKDADDNSDVEMFEEGEIDADEEVVKDTELLLLEATDPELIQSLVSKFQKHPIMINNRWSLPQIQSKLIQNLPQSQFEKCHIILAKANQLRNAKLFIESRTLYLSLLEDIQASLPQLADVINWELLRTDLEHHFDTKDVDERRITDLIVKCNRALRAIDKKNMTEFSELTELCCIFLLESCSASLKDFANSSISIIKFSSCLSTIAFDANAISVPNRVKDLWELILNAFVNPISNTKKTQQMPSLTFSFSFVNFMSKLKDLSVLSLILSCIAKIHNLLRDNPSQELTISTQFASLLPSTLGSYNSILDANIINSTLNSILNELLNHMPNEILILKCKAELSLIDGLYADAIKYFTLILMITTKYFTLFSVEYAEEDAIIHRMITCCVKLGCHTQAAVLHQLTREPNYALAFKALGERNCNDSCDDLYECIWDITLLEFLINLHSRRGEIERKTKAIQLIGQLELNSNNHESVLKEAANVRRGKLLRLFARTYL